MEEQFRRVGRPPGLLETLWSWQVAPRKRMAKLCWQLLVKNHSEEYFDQHFTFDQYWLERQVVGCARILYPIQEKLRWVLEGFQERRLKDHFIAKASGAKNAGLPSTGRYRPIQVLAKASAHIAIP